MRRNWLRMAARVAVAIALAVACWDAVDAQAATGKPAPQMTAAMPKTTSSQRRAAAAATAARKAAAGQKNQAIQPRSGK